eukprot:m.32485 g.32485  ORF g.32485 m.32485 type:complete len:206 (+) comp16652_c0_seq1:92-709(+)
MPYLPVILCCAFIVVGSALSTENVRQQAPAICENIASSKLTSVDSPPCPQGTREWRGAGANLFDVFWAASSGQAMGHDNITYKDSLSELTTAKASGIRVFRAFASDWGPNKIFWVQHKAQYWAEFDRLFDDIDRLGLSWIPSLGTDDWNKVASQSNYRTIFLSTFPDCFVSGLCLYILVCWYYLVVSIFLLYWCIVLLVHLRPTP